MDERLQYQINTMQAFGEGQPIETCDVSRNENWLQCPNPSWNWRWFDYRVAGLTKPSVNWDNVHPHYNYLSKDANGTMWFCHDRPAIDETRQMWTAYSPYAEDEVSALSHISVTPGGCDWKDSLVKRPE